MDLNNLNKLLKVEVAIGRVWDGHSNDDKVVDYPWYTPNWYPETGRASNSSYINRRIKKKGSYPA